MTNYQPTSRGIVVLSLKNVTLNWLVGEGTSFRSSSNDGWGVKNDELSTTVANRNVLRLLDEHVLVVRSHRRET